MKNILFLFISILLSLPVFSQYTVRDISIDTTIHFFGKSVAIPKTYRYNGEKKEIVFPSGAVRWKLYSNEREAEQQGKIEYEKIKSRIRKSGILLVEDRDDIVFRGEKVSANRIRYGTTMVVTGCLFGGPYPEYGVVSDNYSFCVPVDDKFLFMDINFEEERHFDTVYVSLPAFIEENFMRQADKTLLIEPHVVDTIEVKKKKRYLLWHYYDKHTITNGLSLGFSRISSANNVISNGARVEVIGSSLITTVFSLYPYSIITRKEIDEAYTRKQRVLEERYHNRWDDVNGLNFSLFGSMASNTRTNGILLAGVANITQRSNGLSIGGVQNFLSYSNGMQFAGLWNYAYRANGVQLAALGSSAYNFNGLQVSLWNQTSIQMNGIQIGGYNKAGVIHGLQIGIFNNTKILKGFQIGLWNKNKKRSLPFINWGF